MVIDCFIQFVTNVFSQSLQIRKPYSDINNFLFRSCCNSINQCTSFVCMVLKTNVASLSCYVYQEIIFCMFISCYSKLASYMLF